MKVSNLAVNQVVVETNDSKVFSSYETTISEIKDDVVTLDKVYWNYSRTTTKYLGRFLGMNSKAIKKNVENGVFKLANLN